MSGKTVTVFSSEKSQRSRFVRIDNALAQDEKLSFRALGIIAFVLSKPNTWRHSAESLARGNREGIHAIRSALRELADTGHAKLRKTRDRSGRVIHQWIFNEAPSLEKPDTVEAAPSPDNHDTAPSPDSPCSVEPQRGQPQCGEPSPGKPSLSETTVSETTILETTKRETTGGASRLAPSVSFPWTNQTDLPAELQTKLVDLYPDREDQAEVFTTIKGREITFNKTARTIEEWSAVFFAAIIREDEADTRNAKGRALFAHGGRRRNGGRSPKSDNAKRWDGEIVTTRYEPPLTFTDAPGPKGWAEWVAKEYPGSVIAPGGARFTTDWNALESSHQQIIRDGMRKTSAA